VRPFNVEDLITLLARARTANAARGVTGALFHFDGAFLQFLEGDTQAVAETMAIIRADKRHRGILMLCDHSTDLDPLLPDWKMGFYHLSAIEPLVSSVSAGLMENSDEALDRRLGSPAAQDTAGRLLAAFWRASRAQFQRPGPVLQPD
jgi:hypothetical protein